MPLVRTTEKGYLRMTNYKLLDSTYSSALKTVEGVVAEYKIGLLDINALTIRATGTQFSTSHVRACSEWVSYFSNFSEVWSFFLVFYFIALSFFFFYIIPEALATTRLALNQATSKSWLSGLIACGVPFVLTFSILYESVYMLFINETYNGKILPTFSIEGRQWKWEYRYNLSSLLEHLAAYKVVGSGSESSQLRLTPLEALSVVNKLQVVVGKEFLESSLRVKAEFLKATRGGSSCRDLQAVEALNLVGSLAHRPLAVALPEYFSRFRISETSKRMLCVNKTLVLPDTPIIRAHITSADVIHSWTIPGLGIRIDAVPGKLYAIKIPFKYYGVFSGQCSEVCGLRHAYMPISVSFVPYSVFSKIGFNLVFSSTDFFFYRFSNKDLCV